MNKIKHVVLALLLPLVGVIGQAQIPSPLLDQTTIPIYDTVKVIVLTYYLPVKCYDHTNKQPKFTWLYVDNKPLAGYNCILGIDSTLPEIRYVLAWQVRSKQEQLMPYDPHSKPLPGHSAASELGITGIVKYLCYNRKDELTNVLQTWRVEW